MSRTTDDAERSVRSSGRDAPPRDEGPDGPAWEVVQLPAATALLDQQAASDPSERTARSLFQGATLGAVLTALRSGAIVHNEQPDEATTIQGLRGSCVLAVDGIDTEVAAGTLVGIPRGVAWRLQARSDAVILLTVAHV